MHGSLLGTTQPLTEYFFSKSPFEKYLGISLLLTRAPMLPFPPFTSTFVSGVIDLSSRHASVYFTMDLICCLFLRRCYSGRYSSQLQTQLGWFGSQRECLTILVGGKLHQSETSQARSQTSKSTDLAFARRLYPADATNTQPVASACCAMVRSRDRRSWRWRPSGQPLSSKFRTSW